MPGEVTNNSSPQPWNSQHQRIWKLHGRINPWKVVSQDFWKGKGIGLVTGNWKRTKSTHTSLANTS